ncbi:MAG: helix-turn-helix domain-containing protein [Cytophagia bacterium]|nr:MAG: helix-turn-helix domain-containing protein [Runella sp.]TAG17211.1 MAG: helix-turn-helix domain-containing protein [Cytophagales bacterium]TAG36342.1 MAG: helix-turn-helix domain-containing protein [Cytophagia bacterium]TAG69726.1 MAG: helix-turn-helix domain-containing protein [Runella slithyformis]TAG77899.1 MAG: helix-turn-helix domain-containing protein [Cytophagales bacterium]
MRRCSVSISSYLWVTTLKKDGPFNGRSLPYQIATLRNQNFSQSEIANGIGKDKSVICRELKPKTPINSSYFCIRAASSLTPDLRPCD